jgi:agmatinase
VNSPRALPIGKVTLIGLPFDENSSYLRGAAEAPPLIREAFRSESSNPYSEAGIDLSAPGLLADAGDVAPAAGDTMLAQIDEAVDRCLRQDLHPIALGGDHAVTYPILRAFARKFPTLSLLHFDAHPDLYDEFSGNRFSHACPFARIMEERLVGRLVQVGIRAATAHQRAQAARFGVEMREMRDGPIREKLAFDTPLYISFDMDALDPAFAPGVSHPEPGGLSTRDALAVIGAIDVPIVGADVVEFNPTRDRSGLTAMTAAKLVKEIAARMLETLPLLVTA